MTDDERKRQRELFEAWWNDHGQYTEPWTCRDVAEAAWRVCCCCNASGVGEPSEVEGLWEKVRLLHDATIVLRNGMGGHEHWDRTMRHGAGCAVCLRQREAVDEANRLIEEAGKLTALANREERV